MHQKSFFQKLIPVARHALLRFPLTLICAIGIAVSAILLIETGRDERIFSYINLLLTCAIGLPLSIAAQLIVESPTMNNRKRGWVYFAAVLIILIISFSLPSASWEIQSAVPFIRFALFFISAHLLLALMPILYRKGINGFWNYNKSLFIQLFISQVFTCALAWGLQLAFFALKLLFDLDLSERLFFEIAVVVYSVFHTWFFISNYPSDFDQLENEYQYPKGLQVFSQFVLLPLVALYLLILYAYGTKIIFSWTWPKGLVSYLIMCISTIGGLTFLLLHPYAENSGSAWIRKSTRWFYLLLIPLLGILFIAIFMRISDYGFTISRYALLVFGLWALVISIYSQIRRFNIRFIPMSLAIVLIMSSFGPWGFDSFCAGQQKNRLEKILTQSGYLKDGKLIREVKYSDSLLSTISFEKKSKLNDSLHNEVVSIVRYMDDFHTCSVMSEWYDQPVDSLYVDFCKKNKKFNRQFSEREFYLSLMGIDPSGPPENDESIPIQIYDEREPSVFMVNGYDYVIELEQQSVNPIYVNQPVTLFDTTFQMMPDPHSMSIKQLPGDSTTWVVAINEMQDTLNLSGIWKELCLEAKKTNGLATNSDALTITKNISNGIGYKFYFSRIELEPSNPYSFKLVSFKLRALINFTKK